MDYKKKYEQALECAKSCMIDGLAKSSSIEEVIQLIFPELKESEDERIRREIIECLKHNALGYSDNTRNRWIAWLEKQGEQKPDFCHHEVDFSDCSEEYRRAYYDGWNNCNQQHEQLKGEQKPVEWSEEDTERLVKIGECLIRYGNILHDKAACDVFQLSEWLKSLKPQNHWKPSEEQINSLNYFIKLWGKSDEQLEYVKIFNDVKSLYNELKKL